MRELKFRALIKGKNIIRLVAYLKFSDDNELMMVGVFNDNHEISEFIFEDVAIDQSTGLKDKNGETIWEGDTLIRKTEVVKDGYVFDTYTVEFSNGKFYGVPVDMSDELDCEDFEDCEIKKGEQNENN